MVNHFLDFIKFGGSNLIAVEVHVRHVNSK